MFYVYCIQAIEKRVRVLKNVHFDHWLFVLSRVVKNDIKVLKIVQSDCKKKL